MPHRYQGDFVAWNGGCLMIGTGGGVVAPHAHYAIQLVIGAPTGLRVQFGRHAPWQDCAAALVPSRATHTIDVSACPWTAVIFVEPDTPEGRALAARLQGRLEPLDADVVAVVARRLERAWRTEKNPDAVRSVCMEFVRALAHTEIREASDPACWQPSPTSATAWGNPFRCPRWPRPRICRPAASGTCSSPRRACPCAPISCGGACCACGSC